MYRGNGAGGWVTGRASRSAPAGSGFTALTAGGDSQRRRQPRHPRPRVRRLAAALPRQRRRRVHLALPEDRLRLAVALVPHARRRAPRPPPPPPPPAPPAVPIRDGRVTINAGDRCTPPGGRCASPSRSASARATSSRACVKVVFFIRHGPRKVDRKKPYAARLRPRSPRRQEGPRLRARVLQARGSKKLRRKTVHRRYVMCG